MGVHALSAAPCALQWQLVAPSTSLPSGCSGPVAWRAPAPLRARSSTPAATARRSRAAPAPLASARAFERGVPQHRRSHESRRVWPAGEEDRVNQRIAAAAADVRSSRRAENRPPDLPDCAPLGGGLEGGARREGAGGGDALRGGAEGTGASVPFPPSRRALDGEVPLER